MDKPEKCPNCRNEMRLGFIKGGTWTPGGWKTLNLFLARNLARSSRKMLAWRCSLCGRVVPDDE